MQKRALAFAQCDHSWARVWAALLAFVFAAVVLDLVCLYRFIVPQLVVR